MPDPLVRVETVNVDRTGTRQIGTKSRSTTPLSERREEIQEAILEASSLVQEAAAKAGDADGWHVTTLEATFGLTLTVEAGVIVSKASAEASFEVTITVERG
jgi:hypothetical protein